VVLETFLICLMIALLLVSVIAMFTGFVLGFFGRPSANTLVRTGAFAAVLFCFLALWWSAAMPRREYYAFAAVTLGVWGGVWLLGRLRPVDWGGLAVLWAIVPGVAVSSWWLACELVRAPSGRQAAALGLGCGVGWALMSWRKLLYGPDSPRGHALWLIAGLGIVLMSVFAAARRDSVSSLWAAALFWSAHLAWSVPLLLRGRREGRLLRFRDLAPPRPAREREP